MRFGQLNGSAPKVWPVERGNVLPRLAVTMVRHRRRVFAGWLIAVTVGLLGLPHLLSSFVAPAIEVAGSESQQVSQLLAEDLPTIGKEQMIAVLHSPMHRTTEPEFRKAISDTMSALGHQKGVSGVLLLPVAGDPDNLYASAETLEPFRSVLHDEHAAYLLVGASGDDRQRQEQAPALQAAAERSAEAASGGTVQAAVLSMSGFGHVVQQIAISDLMHIELIAVPLAIAVLWLGLRTPVAALIPVGIAGCSIVSTMGLFALLTKVFTIDGTLLIGINAAGLGIGIDYALFVMNRYREELATGAEPERAIATAMATTGRTVLYSALILLLAVVSLFMVRWQVFAQIATGTMVATVVAALASATLLPAVLVSATEWLQRRRRLRSWIPGTAAAATQGGRLSRWAEHLMRHPWRYAVAVTVALLCAAVPASDMSIGMDIERRALTDTPYLAALAVAEREVPGGSGMAVVLVQQPVGAAAVDLQPFADALAADPDVVVMTRIDDDEDRIVFLLLPKYPVYSPAFVQLMARIHTQIAPATVPAGVSVQIGGPSGVGYDVVTETSTKLWWVVGSVLLLLFAVLAGVLRSLLLPVKAIVMSLLATCASYGLMVLIFQPGGSGPPIWPQVPLTVFVLLFALSTDYELFLVRRIQEEYLITGNNRASVIIGIQSTARPISLAAVILAIAYGSLVVSQINCVREFGFAIATGLIIDATLIRLVLVPALMQIMGRWNWWFPQLGLPAEYAHRA
ncbi:MMPL family transporter [Nocardia sp. NPDC046473]|uniref:MMPL family transporter n=1 Tax=Nocardia sp. NPDC046473 TaxID=3155733 RepID=UPI003400D0AD